MHMVEKATHCLQVECDLLLHAFFKLGHYRLTPNKTLEPLLLIENTETSVSRQIKLIFQHRGIQLNIIRLDSYLKKFITPSSVTKYKIHITIFC